MMQETEPSPAARNNGNWWQDHHGRRWQSHPQGARNDGPGWQDREQEARNNGQRWQDRQQEVRNDGNVWPQQEGRNGWQWSSTHGWQWDEWGESTPEPEWSRDTAAAADGYVRLVGARLDDATAPETTDAANTAAPVCLPWPTFAEACAELKLGTHSTDTPSAITDADAATIRAIRAEADAESSSNSTSSSSIPSTYGDGFRMGLPQGDAEDAAAPPQGFLPG